MSAASVYVVDVREILDDLGATIPLVGDVQLADIELGTELFRSSEPAHLDAVLSSAGTGIVLSGTVTTTLDATCSRCLREFPLTITADLDGFYVHPGMEDELPEEQDYEYIDDGSVDLTAAILSAIALELPFAPVHDADCPGICPRCGADLAEGPCGCGADLSRSPFAALADLLPEADGAEE